MLPSPMTETPPPPGEEARDKADTPEEESSSDCWHLIRKSGKSKEPTSAMTREEVYKDIRKKFGLVPSFLKIVPDSSLELE